ncbi:uncharacterized protein METZ01_LOCUS406877, partial [marine metagenome]
MKPFPTKTIFTRNFPEVPVHTAKIWQFHASFKSG